METEPLVRHGVLPFTATKEWRRIFSSILEPLSQQLLNTVRLDDTVHDISSPDRDIDGVCVLCQWRYRFCDMIT